MTEYQFDFDKITIGDVAAIIGKDFELRLMTMHRLTKGGIFHLSAGELQPLLEAFSKAWQARFDELARDYGERSNLRDILADVKVD